MTKYNMLIYITPIGSGKTLTYPIGKDKYNGIIGIAESSEVYGLNYNGGDNISQDKHFQLIYEKTDYLVKKLVIVHGGETIYDISKKIITEMITAIKKNPNVKFHIELSPGYKKLPHILVLISHILFDKIDLITYSTGVDIEVFPKIDVNLSNKELEILEKYYKASLLPDWNGKISRNEYVFTYNGQKNYLYRIINNLKKIGLINDRNRVTDFGKLYIEFANYKEN